MRKYSQWVRINRYTIPKLVTRKSRKGGKAKKITVFCEVKWFGN